jgi:apolipoprotein N-acyltransferase
MRWQGRNVFGIVATLATGALFALSLDVGPAGPLALIAPLPLLVYALAAPHAWKAGLAAFVARALGTTGLFVVYGKIIPVPALIVAVVLFAATYAIVVLLTRWIASRAHAAAAVFVYPLLLASVEWAFGLVAPNGSFGSMGYSLVDILPLLQIASVGGLAALTFVVALVPMTLAVGIVHPATRVSLIAGGVPFLAIIAFGALRLTQPYTSHARVALVGLDSHEARAYRGESEDRDTANAFADLVRALAGAQAEYIVLPEKQLSGARSGAVAEAVLADAAATVAPATVIAGLDEILPAGPRANSALLLRSGEQSQRYLKRRMIPGVELGYTPGSGPFVDGTRGVAICKDMDFPDMIREYGERGVELMLVPAWDFVRDGRMHSRMAVVRGVENGFAMARAAAAGRLTASDRYGRIVAEAVTTPDRAVTVVADLGLRGGGTVFSHIGNLFAWLCMLGSIVFVIWRIMAVR